MNASPRILGITLARGGSKGIHKKNIQPLNGIPLIAYTVAEALRSKLLNRYLVSTDDADIQKVALDYGAEVPFMRPAKFATDQATSVDALKHAVEWVETQEGQRYDFVIELMCTNPMKTSRDIDACIEKLIRTKAESVIGVSRLEDHHPARIKKIVNDRIEDFVVPEPSSRRQDLKPEAYIRNGSIYALRRDTLMHQDARFGTPDSRPYLMDLEKSVNIDSPLDCLTVEALLLKHPRPYVQEYVR